MFTTTHLNKKPAIHHTLTINPSLTYTIETFNRSVDHSSVLQLPQYLYHEKTITSTLHAIDTLSVCLGNAEIHGWYEN